ncbi:MAG TPA: CHC2 zinc finger domain-containing protein [Desulfatiglandales bacterium]|nr:CHC2 zinc finger domain-containing protein [Desulfatiglandales bacterium]
MADYYHELKSKNDIAAVAFGLGYNGSQSGSCYQGDCPRHGSGKGRCLVIWPGIQGFKCYHCGEKGDVIDLVMLYRNCDHRSAVNYLADRVGMAKCGDESITPEELAQREADRKEKTLVEDMLTEAAGWYHQKLEKFPQIVGHLENHYGFSREIIQELQIGFAPPGTSHPDITSDWAHYLESKPAFQGKLALSGLFTFASPQGPFWDFFKGRITFPYWKQGKVVYMAARATDITPVDQYECYTEKDGAVKTDSQGNPEYIKYKKLRTHDPEHDKRQHISRFIQNDSFMGEDSIRGAKEVIITEGAPDLISALDKGFAAISPVTTRFRENDLEKLERLTVGAEALYIINDNEDNRAGLKGALETGKYLTKAGRNVFLVELPRPDGKSKIDLNEYLVDHSAEELRELMQEAKSVLDLLIGELPEDFTKALPAIKSDIAPILAELEGGMLEHYTSQLRKRVNTTNKAIVTEIDLAREEKSSKLGKSPEEALDPEIQAMAQAIAQDPLLLKKRIDVINAAGVVGERKVMTMYFAALDSRLLPDDRKSPNVLAVKNSGHWGGGKSYTLMNCLEIYPESGYHLITNGSAKSLYYLPEGLSHRALVVTEGFQFQSNNAPDSEFVYVTRSLLSEGHVCYQTVEKDDDGKLVTVEKRLDGPTSFITTTILEALEPQFEDRLFTIHPDESVDQTKQIITMTANRKAGFVPQLDEKTVKAWKEFHGSLQPVEVVIPFAPDIAQSITGGGSIPIATRRAFNRVVVVIQTIACTYQYQRDKDEQGRVIAEIIDYYLALQIVREAFRENLGKQSKETEERLKYVQENGPVQYKTLKEEWGITTQGVSLWVAPRVKEGSITWCNEDRNEFADDKELAKAKRRGTAFIKISDDYAATDTIGLPSPYELTGDPKWDEGGELLKTYDLRLDAREVSSIKAVSSAPLDTSETGNIVNIIDYFDDETEGIKVSSQNREDESPKSKDEEPASGQTTTQLLKPYICRSGCKHYDRVKDVNDNDKVKDYCWREGTGYLITEKATCEHFESKTPPLPDGVLGF